MNNVWTSEMHVHHFDHISRRNTEENCVSFPFFGLISGIFEIFRLEILLANTPAVSNTVEQCLKSLTIRS